jgi:predicted DNA-binding protein
MSTDRTIEYCAREAILDYIDEIEERCLARQRAEAILALRASKLDGPG